MQLIFGDRFDLDKLQIYAKGKSILEFRSVRKDIQKIQQIKTEQKSTKKKKVKRAISCKQAITCKKKTKDFSPGGATHI